MKYSKIIMNKPNITWKLESMALMHFVFVFNMRDSTVYET